MMYFRVLLAPSNNNFLLILLACSTLVTAKAQLLPPAPVGGYLNLDTATNVHFGLTAGLENTARGNGALHGNRTGRYNKATGYGALINNNEGLNTAIGESYNGTGTPIASNGDWKAQPVPAGLTTADWDSIRAAREAQRHAIIVSDDGYRAPNPGQQWETEFDGAGFVTQPEKGDWRWGLELRSYGFHGHEQTATKARSTKADGQRVIYERGMGLSE